MVKNLNGVDANVETSLKEYGIAWHISKDDPKNVTVWYGVRRDNNGDWDRFDSSHVPVDMDVYQEYDWVDYKDVYSFVGMDKEEWDKLDIMSKVYNLISYYGCDEILGSCYWEGHMYDSLMEMLEKQEVKS